MDKIDPMRADGHVGWVQIDCADPDALASFWAQVLGMEPDTSQAPPAFRCLQDPKGRRVGPCFQRVPEQKAVKNRVHLDVVVPDLEHATEVVRQLGGSVRGASPDHDDVDRCDARCRELASIGSKLDPCRPLR